LIRGKPDTAIDTAVRRCGSSTTIGHTRCVGLGPGSNAASQPATQLSRLVSLAARSAVAYLTVQGENPQKASVKEAIAARAKWQSDSKPLSIRASMDLHHRFHHPEQERH